MGLEWIIFIIIPLIVVGLYICDKTNLVDLIKERKQSQGGMMTKIKESDCCFTSIISRKCNTCNETTLHQKGRVKQTGKEVKMCIRCWIITKLNH